VVKYPPLQAFVGYRGSFWVDASTLDLIRLRVQADDIPRILKVTAASESIEYRRQNIRGADFLLPKFSELAMSGAGNETRNRTEFSACRPYTVASALRFSPPALPSPVVELKPVTKDAQQPLSADPLLLPRIKAKAAENLQRLPNYTCTQTVERSGRGGNTKNFDLLDRLRLEVALVDGRELFSWPGAGKFEEKGIGEIVGGGAISNGNFALHAKGIFLMPGATFTYAGEEILNGRRALRYDYRVPQMFSIYRLRRTAGNEAFVGHHGAFWVEADTLDLIRLEVHADDIPPSLDLAGVSDAMEYNRLRIRDADFLLPKSSELLMMDVNGFESRNHTEFSACRQYTGESAISFGIRPAVEAVDPESLFLDQVDAIAGFALRGLDFQAVLLGGGREEAPDRMFLPIRGFHDLGQGRPFGPPDQFQDLCSLALGAWRAGFLSVGGFGSLLSSI
jgi:hypothetical protein